MNHVRLANDATAEHYLQTFLVEKVSRVDNMAAVRPSRTAHSTPALSTSSVTLYDSCSASQMEFGPIMVLGQERDDMVQNYNGILRVMVAPPRGAAVAQPPLLLLQTYEGNMVRIATPAVQLDARAVEMLALEGVFANTLDMYPNRFTVTRGQRSAASGTDDDTEDMVGNAAEASFRESTEVRRYLCTSLHRVGSSSLARPVPSVSALMAVEGVVSVDTGRRHSAVAPVDADRLALVPGAARRPPGESLQRHGD